MLLVCIQNHIEIPVSVENIPADKPMRRLLCQFLNAFLQACI